MPLTALRPPSPTPVPAGVATHRGFFLIADISGYTRFVAQNELEHAQGVLHELVTLVMEKLGPPLQFVALEGDAVFCFAPEEAVPDAEHLLQLMEACYAAFAMQLEQMSRGTTCSCSACKAIPTLNLKCVAHYGTYATQKIPTGVQLIGADVTLVHLLLKNTVIERTGVRAYALMTEAFLVRSSLARPDASSALPTEAAQLRPHTEEIEPFGTVHARIADLAASVGRHRERLQAEWYALPIDLEIHTPLSVPAAFVWPYITDPVLRPRWQADIIDVEAKPSPNGRTEIGWESHCHHGGYLMTHRIVDWEPFRRLTMHAASTGRSLTKPPPCQAEFYFDDNSDGTCLLRFIVRLREPGLLGRPLFRLVRPWVRREWQAHFDLLQRVTAEDLARSRAALQAAG